MNQANLAWSQKTFLKRLMLSDTLIIISHYASRSDKQLSALLTQISPFSKNILIVINDDEATAESAGFFKGYPAIFRPNIGMNIGGWNAAFKRHPIHKYYIFLQDECTVMRSDFISAYEGELAKLGVGMTGESINKKWDKPWGEMLKSPLNYLVDKNISRVEYYLYLMSVWRINPVETGRHLRSLVWGFSNQALGRLGGFPMGSTKEECIASEIAVSKKIEQLGLSVTQISDSAFTFFGHEEWRTDGTSKI